MLIKKLLGKINQFLPSSKMVFKLARKTLFEKKVFFLLVLAVHNQNLHRGSNFILFTIFD